MKNIGQVSQLTGFSQRMLRYLEEQGLLSVVRRAGGGRTYSDSDITQLLRIRQLHELGFSYAQIKALLGESEAELAAKGTELLAAHHRTATDLLEKIQRLELMCFGEKKTDELRGNEQPKRTLLSPRRTAYSLRRAEQMQKAFATVTGLTGAEFNYWKFGDFISEFAATPVRLELCEIFDQSA